MPAAPRRQGKDQPGAQSAPGRVAADRIAEDDRPGVLVRGDAVHADPAGTLSAGWRRPRRARVEQSVIPDAASPAAVRRSSRQSRQRPFRIRWWSRTATPVSRSSAAKSPDPIRHGTGTSCAAAACSTDGHDARCSIRTGRGRHRAAACGWTPPAASFSAARKTEEKSVAMAALDEGRMQLFEGPGMPFAAGHQADHRGRNAGFAGHAEL